MPYKFYTDKSEQFECSIDIKNASLKNASARLVLENSDVNLIFKGKIENKKCIISVKKLDGILKENSTGKVKLEVIVDGMYFSPWESDYTIDRYNDIKVEVVEQKETTKSKPIVEVKTSVPTTQFVSEESKNRAPKIKPKAKTKSFKNKIIEELNILGIDKSNFKTYRYEFEEIIKSNLPKDYKVTKQFVTEILDNLK